MRSVLCCCKTSGLLHLPSQNLKSLYRRLHWVQSHVLSRYLNNTLPSQCSVIVNDWPYMPRVVKGDEEPLIAQAQLKSQPAGHILLMTFFNRKKQRKWVLQLNRKKKVLYIIQSNLNKIIRERASQWAQCKESAASARDAKDMGSIPGSGRSLGGGNGIPLQYSCLENSINRGAWQATVHGSTESEAAEHASGTRIH